ncbi:hypothetical protein Scep_002201 [Stephania cephalantha]|uniref:Plastocyanin-like domain-containing protein n=1 Tax=Stephania cephalantha TaxID=152367 RepID=A0AAP0LC82_9MAGN
MALISAFQSERSLEKKTKRFGILSRLALQISAAIRVWTADRGRSSGTCGGEKPLRQLTLNQSGSTHEGKPIRTVANKANLPHDSHIIIHGMSETTKDFAASLQIQDLDTYGVWRAWLGDSSYATFAAFLASQSSWDAFMGTDNSKSRAQIRLQLRVRARFFDKAGVSLFLRSSSSSSRLAASSVILLLRTSIRHLLVFLRRELPMLLAFSSKAPEHWVVLKNISRLCGTKPIVTVNKQFLGPTLYAREGDRVLVKVVNHVKYNLSIHCDL